MAKLYADEQFPLPVVEYLRSLGHDILTLQEAGKGSQGISDEEVLDFACQQSRAVLTLNRKDFVRLHRLQLNHSGIIVCSQDTDWQGQAIPIHEAILKEENLNNKLIRVNRPGK
ncbi:conserved hypothetical protein [Gloeothece citriformis PCC 7424]|uniref:DUF5615 domain-containing protein n=1 Tax=Gloeothece citriformis (strain PCC 7424) TaxID=65393 RepID=B7KJI0_GLOC7|nr:DUF5615 family PIN-like protein [Gloeothece citriformis]ACK73657.1 conserved hypothetical protein [Gloeothece citriformis PCC 7424]